jgi:4-hydroxybenzoate polyprenyltransferase
MAGQNRNIPHLAEADDISLSGFWQLFPEFLHPFIVIARLDRPIGWWLLILPGWWVAAALAPSASDAIGIMALFMAGGIATRGAGCVINDIWDRDIDRRVARTANRPLAAGTMTLFQAGLFLCILTGISLAVLVQLPPVSWLVGIASAPLVILYPLAKRVTYFPQIVLGLTFSWAAPTAYAAVMMQLPEPALLIIYAGTVCWVFGYDTIYAVQDMADDRHSGVKSSAIGLGRHLRLGVGLAYLSALILWGAGFYLIIGAGIWLAGLAGAGCHFIWQMRQLAADAPQTARKLFISNRDCGLILSAGFLASQLTG